VIVSDRFISIEGISRRFPAPAGGFTAVFSDLWLAMRRGEFVCIIGHSGCGKTTVLNILAGLDTPSAGAVIVDGKAIEGPSLDRAVIFQSHALLSLMRCRRSGAIGRRRRSTPTRRSSSISSASAAPSISVRRSFPAA
jgi:ABC-type nitrate/sulfonate/bicarbonate transport system ATPase subunit